MDNISEKLSRRALLYGAGSLTATSVLSGCSSGSNDNNKTTGGVGTESGTTKKAAADTEAEARTKTETETGSVTELIDTETTGMDSDANASTEAATESEITTTGSDTNRETDSEMGTGSTDSNTGDQEDEYVGGGGSERLTYGEIRQQPPDTLDNLNQEYVELINASGSTIDLAGYSITYGEAEYTFDEGFALPVGERVTVHTGSGNDSITDVYVGRNEVALNYQGPDNVTVTNADGTVVLKATA